MTEEVVKVGFKESKEVAVLVTHLGIETAKNYKVSKNFPQAFVAAFSHPDTAKLLSDAFEDVTKIAAEFKDFGMDDALELAQAEITELQS